MKRNNLPIDKNSTDLKFITDLVNKGATVQNIGSFKLPILDTLKFIKLGGQKFIELNNRLANYTKKEKYYNQELSDKKIYLIDTIMEYFDTFTEKNVKDAMILIKGKESFGKGGGAKLFEGFKIKKEPYNNVYTFNIVYENGNVLMDTSHVEKDEVFAALITTYDYPTKEQLICMLISPEKIDKTTFINDFGEHACFVTTFDPESIY